MQLHKADHVRCSVRGSWLQHGYSQRLKETVVGWAAGGCNCCQKMTQSAVCQTQACECHGCPEQQCLEWRHSARA